MRTYCGEGATKGGDFANCFRALTGSEPFPWQRRLFQCLLGGDIPEACDIPTGLGKTSVIVIWLLALARQAEGGRVQLPRRLVYVVDRRTVVDQATDIAEGLRRRLRAALGREATVADDNGGARLGPECLVEHDANPLARARIPDRAFADLVAGILQDQRLGADLHALRLVGALGDVRALARGLRVAWTENSWTEACRNVRLRSRSGSQVQGEPWQVHWQGERGPPSGMLRLLQGSAGGILVNDRKTDPEYFGTLGARG